MPMLEIIGLGEDGILNLQKVVPLGTGGRYRTSEICHTELWLSTVKDSIQNTKSMLKSAFSETFWKSSSTQEVNTF